MLPEYGSFTCGVFDCVAASRLHPSRMKHCNRPCLLLEGFCRAMGYARAHLFVMAYFESSPMQPVTAKARAGPVRQVGLLAHYYVRIQRVAWTRPKCAFNWSVQFLDMSGWHVRVADTAGHRWTKAVRNRRLCAGLARRTRGTGRCTFVCRPGQEAGRSPKSASVAPIVWLAGAGSVDAWTACRRVRLSHGAATMRL